MVSHHSRDEGGTSMAHVRGVDGEFVDWPEEIGTHANSSFENDVSCTK